VSIGSTRGPAYRMCVAKVAESDTGFYISLSSTRSLKNFGMTGCYVHCYITSVVGRYRWVNIRLNQSRTELCIYTVQVGLRKQATRQGEGLTDMLTYAVCEGQVVFCWYRVQRVSWEHLYRGADKSLARPTSQCILFDGENISFDASLVVYINSTSIPPIIIISRIYEN
jgi:hypothetical protein